MNVSRVNERCEEESREEILGHMSFQYIERTYDHSDEMHMTVVMNHCWFKDFENCRLYGGNIAKIFKWSYKYGGGKTILGE